ncbi:hypothetical protein MUP79_07675 [Candidatus Bathyarchaeota archaeon]|nr:hypothetical protein [Candidatus Bathyarchaeota archaeon]
MPAEKTVCTGIVKCVSIKFEECIDFEELKMNDGHKKNMLNVPIDLEFAFYDPRLYDF